MSTPLSDPTFTPADSAPPTVIVDAAEYLKLIRSDSQLRQELKELKQQYDWRMEDIGRIRAAFTGITKEDSLIDFAAKTSAALTATQSALSAAREAIEKAPHGSDCSSLYGFSGQLTPCTCWKAEALAQIDTQQSKTT